MENSEISIFMKFRHKIRSNHFPEVDKFFYWVDICLLSGFLSSFQKKTRKRFTFV